MRTERCLVVNDHGDRGEAENKSLTASRYAARTLQQLVHRTTITNTRLATNLFFVLCIASAPK